MEGGGHTDARALSPRAPGQLPAIRAGSIRTGTEKGPRASPSRARLAPPGMSRAALRAARTLLARAPPAAPPRGARTAAMAARRYIDIGANLLDPMFAGEYHGKQAHEPDLDRVLERAWAAGVDRMIVTAGTLGEARAALELCRRDPRLFCTVGVHPTRCGEFEDNALGGPDAYLAELVRVAEEGKALGKVVAVGECGLDYARLQFCDAATQRRYFARQFDLVRATGLPMFLHLRDATDDFLQVLAENADALAGTRGAVVHSFDGSAGDLRRVLAHERLMVGLNGCSLKTEENLAVAREVPVDRLMVETDCPWCDCRPSHASAAHIAARPPARDKKRWDAAAQVKGRNEPCNIGMVVEAIAGAKGVADVDALCEAIHANTVRVFF